MWICVQNYEKNARSGCLCIYFPDDEETDEESDGYPYGIGYGVYPVATAYAEGTVALHQFHESSEEGRVEGGLEAFTDAKALVLSGVIDVPPNADG